MSFSAITGKDVGHSYAHSTNLHQTLAHARGGVFKNGFLKIESLLISYLISTA
jgi:hypothetical protein